jgi:hypothetical protein
MGARPLLQTPLICMCYAEPRSAVLNVLARRLYIALSFGFSLAVNAWVFFRVSGYVLITIIRSLTLTMYP